MGQDLVYIGTASNQSEAGALRAYLEAYGVHAYVQGEHHSSLLGPLGGFFIELRVLVPEAEQELARELLEAFHSAEPLAEEADVGEFADVEAGEDESADTADDKVASPRRVALLAIVPGFGLAHMVTGATGRGLGLMLLEALGLAWIVGGDVMRGTAMALVAVTLDLVFATRRAQERAQAGIPAARVRSGETDR